MDSAGLALTTLLGEQVRVQLQTEQYCTKCGSQAGGSICQDCAGTPPIATCVQQPAERCQYADCPFPDYKQRSCSHEFVVYLAAAGDVKVGITKRTRTISRWQEQGANRALPIAIAPNRKAAGIIEQAASRAEGIGQRLKHAWYEPMENPEETLVDAVFDAREMVPERLSSCFRWSEIPSRSYLLEEVVEVPYLATDGLNHRLTSRLGVLQPGHAREGQVIGVRGSIVATDEFVINTRRYAGHGITIETDAPFVKSFNADSPDNPFEQAEAKSGDLPAQENAVADGGEKQSESNSPEYPLSDFF